VKIESKAVNALWEAGCRPPEWEGSFGIPVNHKIVGPFGQKSIINKKKRSPHTGVDIRGKTGAPVRAANSGSVVLVADHFFTGKSVYVDHGSCIFSMYFHLDSIQVDQGDSIEKGQILGRVGATGRATGPHLHWGVRVSGARVNPLTLIELSRELDP
jgi:murein DD-endopeptidase MepM/ murein hydrolase activator NlpD